MYIKRSRKNTSFKNKGIYADVTNLRPKEYLCGVGCWLPG